MLTAEPRTHRKTQTAERLASPPLQLGTAFIGLSGAVEALLGISANRRWVELVGGSRKATEPILPMPTATLSQLLLRDGASAVEQIVQPSIGIRESITTRCGQWSHSCDLIPGHQVMWPKSHAEPRRRGGPGDRGGLSARGSVGPPVAEARPIHHWAPVPISRVHSQLAHTAAMPMCPDFKKLCEVANIPPRRLHDLRHSAATMMLDNDLDLKTVGQLLGGSDVCLPTPPCCFGLVAQKCWQNGSIHHWVLGSRRREGFELLEQALGETSGRQPFARDPARSARHRWPTPSMPRPVSITPKPGASWRPRSATRRWPPLAAQANGPAVGTTLLRVTEPSSLPATPERPC